MSVCYLMVTCVREGARKSILDSVIESFAKQDEYWKTWQRNFHVFDNASTYHGAHESIDSLKCSVHKASENYGYWNAVNWFLVNIAKDFDFIYVIESDAVHFEIEKLHSGIQLLESDDVLSVGAVRTQEFSVENRHLYDKRNPHPDSRRTEWCVQHNMFTNTDAFFEPTPISNVWETNLVAKMCGLHRTKTLQLVFERLSQKPFNEVDFQRTYHDFHHTNALIDGGIFHTRLSYGMFEGSPIPGGTIIEGPAGTKDRHGYVKTRDGILIEPSTMEVA